MNYKALSHHSGRSLTYWHRTVPPSLCQRHPVRLRHPHMPRTNCYLVCGVSTVAAWTKEPLYESTSLLLTNFLQKRGKLPLGVLLSSKNTSPQEGYYAIFPRRTNGFPVVFFYRDPPCVSCCSFLLVLFF